MESQIARDDSGLEQRVGVVGGTERDVRRQLSELAVWAVDSGVRLAIVRREDLEGSDSGTQETHPEVGLALPSLRRLTGALTQGLLFDPLPAPTHENDQRISVLECVLAQTVAKAEVRPQALL